MGQAPLYSLKLKGLMMHKSTLICVTLTSLIVCVCSSAEAEIRIVDRPSTTTGNDHYVGNRTPLLPSPFMKLPVGAIEPQGWVRKQLELQADGFHGHLTEISRFLVKEGNASNSIRIFVEWLKLAEDTVVGQAPTHED